MKPSDPLIRTKLRLPFTRPGLVSRPRLQELVAQGLCGPLTLITAPAGFGKTTLAAACAADSGMPAAWLSLDKNDNQAGRFLSYLTAALQEAESSIGSDAEQMLAGSQQAPPEAILTSLINDLAGTQKEMVLVLDDYQFISNQSVNESTAFLLDHCPENLHLMIASRSDPPLPMARLRARGQTVELRAADLRFKQDEALQFLNDIMGLHLNADAVGVLEKRTEGWIAGLQMAALSMRGRKDAEGFIREFAGTNRFIMDFLLEEVLAHEPEEVQNFLLQTSVLPRLCGALCDAVTGIGGGQEMLERLEKRNLFVMPLDDERRWYRYHQLFADLLQARLHQSGPEQAAVLRSRAAAWCEQDGQFAEAVGYALAAKNYPLASVMIAKYWHFTANSGDVETAWAWLKALPDGMVKGSAALGTSYCWVLWLKGRMGEIEAHLADAENALCKQAEIDGYNPENVKYAEFTTQFAVLRSIIARLNGKNIEAGILAERALKLMPESMPTPITVQLKILIYLALASAYEGSGNLEKSVSAYHEIIRYSQLSKTLTGLGVIILLSGNLRVLGRLREAEKACREVLGFSQAQGLGNLPAGGVLHVALGEVLVEQNKLKEAEDHLSQGIGLGKWGGRLDAEKNAIKALSRIKQIHNDPTGALETIKKAESELKDVSSPLSKAEMLGVKARALIQQGHLSEARNFVNEALQLTKEDLGQTREFIDLTISRVILAESTPSHAVEELTRSLDIAEKRGRFGAALELRILRSQALAKKGDTRGAEVDLEKALAQAGPEGFVRIFLDEGQPMQALIKRWLANAGKSPVREYASQLLSQFAAEVQANSTAQDIPRQPGGLPEPLSQRELEVLQLMAKGMTNQEIAQQLIVAPGTVKAHTASIYRKLDAANRTEAAARARQLGILP